MKKRPYCDEEIHEEIYVCGGYNGKTRYNNNNYIVEFDDGTIIATDDINCKWVQSKMTEFDYKIMTNDKRWDEIVDALHQTMKRIEFDDGTIIATDDINCKWVRSKMTAFDYKIITDDKRWDEIVNALHQMMKRND